MGVSIYLKRIGPAEKLIATKSLAQKLANPNTPTLNMESFGEDLAIVFLNRTDFYNDVKQPGYRILYGNPVDVHVGDYRVGGFLPGSEVKEICAWIRKHQLTAAAGFDLLYSRLTKEALDRLREIDAEEKNELYAYEVKPLVQFFLAAEKEKSAIVFYGL